MCTHDCYLLVTDCRNQTSESATFNSLALRTCLSGSHDGVVWDFGSHSHTARPSWPEFCTLTAADNTMPCDPPVTASTVLERLA